MANANENVKPVTQIEDLPDPQVSDPQVGQAYEPASEPSVTLEAVEALLDKKFQSMKDTRLGKMEAKLTDMESAFAEVRKLTSAGMSSEEAQAKVLGEKRIQDLESQIQALQTGKEIPAQSPGGEKAVSWKERQASILSEHGIAADDPRNIELLRNSSTQEEYVKSLEQKINDWSFADTKKPQPSGDTVAQTVPSVPAGDGSYTPEKYKADMLAAIGDKNKIKAIKAAARKDGVDVDNIGFV